MDNKFVYQSIYKHEVRNSLPRSIMVGIAWTALAIWFIIDLIKFGFAIGAISVNIPIEIIAILFWKQILSTIILVLYLPFEKEIKEECNCELTIEENKVKILYKDLNYNDKEYGGLVNTLEIYEFKEMNQFISFEGGLKFRGKSKYIIYNKSGKKVYTYTNTHRNEVKFYVPTNIVFEVYKAITTSMKDINKKGAVSQTTQFKNY